MGDAIHFPKSVRCHWGPGAIFGKAVLHERCSSNFKLNHVIGINKHNGAEPFHSSATRETHKGLGLTEDQPDRLFKSSSSTEIPHSPGAPTRPSSKGSKGKTMSSIFKTYIHGDDYTKRIGVIYGVGGASGRGMYVPTLSETLDHTQTGNIGECHDI